MNYLKKKKIFDKEKIKFLPDPILFEEEIKKNLLIKKKIKIK